MLNESKKENTSKAILPGEDGDYTIVPNCLLEALCEAALQVKHPSPKQLGQTRRAVLEAYIRQHIGRADRRPYRRGVITGMTRAAVGKVVQVADRDVASRVLADVVRALELHPSVEPHGSYISNLVEPQPSVLPPVLPSASAGSTVCTPASGDEALRGLPSAAGDPTICPTVCSTVCPPTRKPNASKDPAVTQDDQSFSMLSLSKETERSRERVLSRDDVPSGQKEALSGTATQGSHATHDLPAPQHPTGRALSRPLPPGISTACISPVSARGARSKEGEPAATISPTTHDAPYDLEAPTLAKSSDSLSEAWNTIWDASTNAPSRKVMPEDRDAFLVVAAKYPNPMTVVALWEARIAAWASSKNPLPRYYPRLRLWLESGCPTSLCAPLNNTGAPPHKEPPPSKARYITREVSQNGDEVEYEVLPVDYDDDDSALVDDGLDIDVEGSGEW